MAYSALYHNSFILGYSCSRNVAWDICRRRESDIRARGQTNPIHPGPIRTDLVEWIDPLLYALPLSEFFLTWTRRTSFDYSWDIVETFCYGGEWGVKTPMQQRTTAWIGSTYIKTDDRERKAPRSPSQVVDLSVLAAASFRIVITLSLS